MKITPIVYFVAPLAATWANIGARLVHGRGAQEPIYVAPKRLLVAPTTRGLIKRPTTSACKHRLPRMQVSVNTFASIIWYILLVTLLTLTSDKYVYLWHTCTVWHTPDKMQRVCTRSSPLVWKGSHDALECVQLYFQAHNSAIPFRQRKPVAE
eukprot:COSAG05_NODE_921_length_6590_cov_2.081985_7_plen_153_part_00